MAKVKKRVIISILSIKTPRNNSLSLRKNVKKVKELFEKSGKRVRFHQWNIEKIMKMSNKKIKMRNSLKYILMNIIQIKKFWKILRIYKIKVIGAITTQKNYAIIWLIIQENKWKRKDWVKMKFHKWWVILDKLVKSSKLKNKIPFTKK